VASLFATLNVVAQEKISFRDEFNDATQGWAFVNSSYPEIKRTITNGKYIIEHNDATKSYWDYIPLFCNPNKPFTLETNIVQTSGEGTSGFGIVIFGGNQKYYYFIINPKNQSYYVGSSKNGTWTKYYTSYDDKWPISTAINKGQENNNLKVRHADDKLLFLVNDKEVFSSNFNPDFSDMPKAYFWGLVTWDKMVVEVNDYTFYQDNPARNLVPDLPKLTRVNLGTNVNTKYTEKWPYIAPDGKTLYYDVEGDPENLGTTKTDEIYYSTAIDDSTWGKRQNMGWPLNNAWPNCVISASPDNNTLYLLHTYNADGSGKAAGVSMTTRTEKGWAVPTDVKIQNYYNRASFNEFCMSPNKKVLLMAIQRDDTYGDKDIYASFLQENGEFSEPKNLGQVINTFAAESSPFLAADGVTMYYSTSGYPGYGDADIYMTRRLDSTWTNWSAPQNMGPDINSANWEGYYTIPASGKYAYVVSSNGGIEGSLDLFRVKLPQALKPEPVVLIYGKVLNSKTKEPICASITYNYLSSNKEAGIASSNPKDGSYKLVLPAGAVYSFLAEKESFYSVSENIDVSKLKEYKEIERNLYLAPLEVGETIRLNNLFFDFNKYNLRNESYAELDRVIQLLKNKPTMVIEIAGHTDNVGNDVLNNKLSQDRAVAVKNYLIGKGIQSERIVSKGYGKTKPSTTNETEEGRQMNRRVEFTILKN